MIYSPNFHFVTNMVSLDLCKGVWDLGAWQAKQIYIERGGHLFHFAFIPRYPNRFVQFDCKRAHFETDPTENVKNQPCGSSFCTRAQIPRSSAGGPWDRPTLLRPNEIGEMREQQDTNKAQICPINKTYSAYLFGRYRPLFNLGVDYLL